MNPCDTCNAPRTNTIERIWMRCGACIVRSGEMPTKWRPIKATYDIDQQGNEPNSRYRPRGGMCVSCAKAPERCAALPFADMPVIDRDPDNTIVVRCTEFQRSAQGEQP